MTPATLCALSASEAAALPPPLHALWLDAHGDWPRAHSLVDELETPALQNLAPPAHFLSR